MPTQSEQEKEVNMKKTEEKILNIHNSMTERYLKHLRPCVSK